MMLPKILEKSHPLRRLLKLHLSHKLLIIQFRGRVPLQPPKPIHLFRGDSNPEVNIDIPIHGENPIPNVELHENFQGENENENNDSDAQSEFKDVNAELDPTYDSNYPSLNK